MLNDKNQALDLLKDRLIKVETQIRPLDVKDSIVKNITEIGTKVIVSLYSLLQIKHLNHLTVV